MTHHDHRFSIRQSFNMKDLPTDSTTNSNSSAADSRGIGGSTASISSSSSTNPNFRMNALHHHHNNNASNSHKKSFLGSLFSFWDNGGKRRRTNGENNQSLTDNLLRHQHGNEDDYDDTEMHEYSDMVADDADYSSNYQHRNGELRHRRVHQHTRMQSSQPSNYNHSSTTAPNSRNHSPSIFKLISNGIYHQILRIKRFVPLAPAPAASQRHAYISEAAASLSHASIVDSHTTAQSQGANRAIFASTTRTIITKYDSQLRTLNLLLSILAFFGILLMVAQLFLNFSWWSGKKYAHILDFSLILDQRRFSTSYIARHENISTNTFLALGIAYYSLQVLNLLNTCFVLVLLCIYYYFRSKKRREEIGLASKLGAFLYDGLWWDFTRELLCLIWTPIPFSQLLLDRIHVHSVFSMNEAALLMFLRLYLILRLVRDFSSVYQKRHKIVASNRALRQSTSKFGWQITLRLLLFSHTFTVILSTFFLSTVVITFCIWITERAYNPDLVDIREALYFTLQTMCTIGYGTYAPSRRLTSRILALGQSLTGIVIMAFFSAVVVNRIRPSPHQITIARFNYREKYVRKRLNESVRIVQINFLYRKGKCSSSYRFETLRRSIKKLRHYKKKIAQFDEGFEKESLQNVAYTNGVMKKKVDDLRLIVQELKMTLAEAQIEK